ncbi:hypothetical protein FALB51S_00089 [Frigidibacter albus]
MSFAMSPLRRAALSVKNSEVVRELKVYPGYPAFRAARRSGETVAFDIRTRMGMGAILSYALRLYAWSETEGVDVQVGSSSPLYSDGGDFFARFFELGEATLDGPALSFAAQEWAFRKEVPQHIPLDEACAQAAQHFRPNNRLRGILDEVRRDAAFDLSIHFRGTDKVLDSGKVDYAPMMAALAPRIGTAQRIFLATDDAGFSALLRAEYGDRIFVSYDLGEVEDGRPRHFSDMPADLKAQEALVNIFLIASAPLCVRTSSFMSSFSRIVNPALVTHTINKTILAKTPFPERELLAAEFRLSAP